MFRLQKLEITGFKSFADYTEVVFTGDGITAVVGPNGCGKSNVSDAIAWVLGEQSAKSLRGGEMQDVIFQGAKSRQPSGMAEVVLHLIRDEVLLPPDETEDIDEALADFDEYQNEIEIAAETNNGNGHHAATNGNGNGFHKSENGNGLARIEVASIEATAVETKTHQKRRWKARRATFDFAPGEAVSLTRRLYRSGESEYLLNGRACRLRDIQDLFAGTGLSGAHYALVQQERISQILSAKPTDRRNLIEEAAGITKFRTRQRAVEVRLESAKTNLRRISDIVSEVERQANALRRQASRTRRYKTMRDELRELLQKVFAAEGRELTQALESLREKLTNAISTEQTVARSVETHSEKSGAATQKAREAEETLAQIRGAAAEAALKRERAARDFAHQTEQAANLEERCAALKREIKTSEERLTSVAADAARLREKNQQSQSSNEAEIAVLKSAEGDYALKQAEVRKIESEIEQIRARLLQHTAAAERFREIARQQTNALERLTERAKALEKEGERAAQTHVERQREFELWQAKIAVAVEDLSELQTARHDLQQAVKLAREALQTSEKEFGKVRDEANGVRHRRETLEKLDSQNALLAPAVQKLFAAKDKLGIQVNGTLADFLRVEARFEKAVEAVFGSFLQTVLVDSNETSLKIADWLKTSDAGQIKVLSQKFKVESSIKNKTSDLKLQTLDSVLGVSNELFQILHQILPEQMSFRVIENAVEAENFAAENCVTLSGELIYRNRLFSFGNQQSNAKNGGILGFKRELRELAARAEKLKTELETAEKAVKTARESLSEREKSVSDLQSNTAKAERELMSLEMNAKSLGQEIERAERHKRVVEDESKRLENERKDAEARREKAESDSKIAENARVAASTKLAEISASLVEAKQKAERANSVLSEKRSEIAAANERRRSLVNALRRVESEQSELSWRLQKQQKELSDAAARLEQLKCALAESKTQVSSIEGEKEYEAKRIAQAAQNLQFARDQADKLAIELKELNAQAAQAKDARSAFEVRQAEIVARLRNLHENCHQELNVSLETLFANKLFEDDFDLTTEKRRVDELRDKLENFGAVNLLALEELSEAEERLLFLSSQRKDIVDGIMAAEEALDEIKRRSRARFEEAFTAINQNFTQLFQELFGGGRGEMSLLNSEDVLESGIEIVAQPPGKRLQNLLLLSGGEKAMTAIALIMAIFRFRPSPFCLLDEVDAPLDEANVGRFVEKIAQMSEQTQFIVITHNKRTMEAARALYGVTMEEAGISKVVSVKFE